MSHQKTVQFCAKKRPGQVGYSRNPLQKLWDELSMFLARSVQLDAKFVPRTGFKKSRGRTLSVLTARCEARRLVCVKSLVGASNKSFG
jgi:hypothetical protein